MQVPFTFGVEVFEPGHVTKPHAHSVAHEMFLILAGDPWARPASGPLQLPASSPCMLCMCDCSTSDKVAVLLPCASRQLQSVLRHWAQLALVLSLQPSAASLTCCDAMQERAQASVTATGSLFRLGRLSSSRPPPCTALTTALGGACTAWNSCCPTTCLLRWSRPARLPGASGTRTCAS